MQAVGTVPATSASGATHALARHFHGLVPNGQQPGRCVSLFYSILLLEYELDR